MLQGSCYAGWPLHYFTAYITPTPSKSADLALSSCKSAMAAALPLLETLDVNWTSSESTTAINIENEGTLADEHTLGFWPSDLELFFCPFYEDLLYPITMKGSSTPTSCKISPWGSGMTTWFFN